jgi:hypothetical protein
MKSAIDEKINSFFEKREAEIDCSEAEKNITEYFESYAHESHVIKDEIYEKKLDEANAVIDYLEKYYTKKRILGPNVDPTFFDLMKVTCFVHNLFIDDSWVSVFKAREVLQDKALSEYKISWENVQHIFSMVEAQFGTDMPVVSCHVKPGTPQDDFVTACWVVKEYLNREKCYSSRSDKGKA